MAIDLGPLDRAFADWQRERVEIKHDTAVATLLGGAVRAVTLALLMTSVALELRGNVTADADADTDIPYIELVLGGCARLPAARWPSLAREGNSRTRSNGRGPMQRAW